MAFPIIPIITFTTLAFSFKNLIYNLLQMFINNKIDYEIESQIKNVRNNIILDLKKYFKNFYITVAVDAAIILFAFLIFLILNINPISITIYSIIIIAVISRYIFNIVKDVKKIKPYYATIKLFLKNVLKCKSFKEAVKHEVFKKVETYYYENTTKFVRKLHSIGSDIGLVKSIYTYQNIIYTKIISFINEKSMKRNFILAGIILIFYSTIALVIILILFSVTLNMYTIDIVLYPIKLLLSFFIK